MAEWRRYVVLAWRPASNLNNSAMPLWASHHRGAGKDIPPNVLAFGQPCQVQGEL